MDILFILFPGFFGSNKFWSNKLVNNKLVPITFLDELKKLGSVYIFEPKYYNLYYYKKDDIYKELFESDIYFNNQDLDIDYICHNLFKQFSNYKFIVPIGHSYGSIFVYKFIKLYPSKCLCSVIIDGTPLGPVSKVMEREDIKFLNIPTITDNELLLLEHKVKDNCSESRKQLINYVDAMIGKQRIKEVNQIPISILSFINFNTETDNKIIKQINIDRIKEINYFNRFENYCFICFKNKGHYIFWDDEASLKIISCIKEIVNK
jgi:hypothetical protein